MNSFQTDSLLWQLDEERNSTALLGVTPVKDRLAEKRITGGISDPQFILSIGTIAGIFGFAMYLAWHYLR
jgi:hypothetical protein